jgi:hypothetical protein
MSYEITYKKYNFDLGEIVVTEKKERIIFDREFFVEIVENDISRYIPREMVYEIKHFKEDNLIGNDF